ncbi:MAG: PhoU domain-containing protein [Planctomycetota bacterium]|jgi:phosphate uptake regulator
MGIINTLINAWMNRNILEGLYNTFAEMLDGSYWMFQYVHEVMLGKDRSASDREKFFQTDQSINRREQEIRGKILNHLIMNPCDAVTECLIFMSVVKDAERLGDYCKNILEVVERPKYQHEWKKIPQSITLAEKGIQTRIFTMFTKTKDVFISQDEEDARIVLKLYHDVKKECDDSLNALLELEDLSPRAAIFSSLIIRFLRRIASHLANINSSVLLPLHQIDFNPPHED